jgi:hypothetical protein
MTVISINSRTLPHLVGLVFKIHAIVSLSVLDVKRDGFPSNHTAWCDSRGNLAVRVTTSVAYLLKVSWSCRLYPTSSAMLHLMSLHKSGKFRTYNDERIHDGHLKKSPNTGMFTSFRHPYCSVPSCPHIPRPLCPMKTVCAIIRFNCPW